MLRESKYRGSELRIRDNRLWLDIESSNILTLLAKHLSAEFPEAKFIITIRDCYSWLDSYLNHQVNYPNRRKIRTWRKYRDLIFKPSTFQHSSDESVLAEKSLYTLDGYLSYWKMVNWDIVGSLPTSRVLIVKTYEIKQSLNRIADFLDIPVEHLNQSRSHLYRARKTYGLLSEIDREFLQEKADRHCAATMERYYPEIRKLEDARKSDGTPLVTSIGRSSLS